MTQQYHGHRGVAARQQRQRLVPVFLSSSVLLIGFAMTAFATWQQQEPLPLSPRLVAMREAAIHAANEYAARQAQKGREATREASERYKASEHAHKREAAEVEQRRGRS